MSLVELQCAEAVATLTLNRPKVHNALDEALIVELAKAIEKVSGDDAVRVVVLAGKGASFCAGADLDWMRRAAAFSEQQNLDDARSLAHLLDVLARCPKPTIAMVQGAAIGGGAGLVAACDFAIATHDAQFAFSEAKLGLVPAVISPYVIRAIGPRAAQRLFLTAQKISADQARELGLVSEVVDAETDPDLALSFLIRTLKTCGPQALAEIKALIAQVADQPITPALIEHTAQAIARLRVSAEGREGIQAFLEKRRAPWCQGVG